MKQSRTKAQQRAAVRRSTQALRRAIGAMDFVASGTYEIEIACERFPAQASLRPLYDPKSERVRA